MLRSSPTPKGRCCVGPARGSLRPVDVAILADPEGPVLAHRTPRSCPATGAGCDPRRPRRAGAGCRGAAGMTPWSGCCDPRRPRRAGAGRRAGTRPAQLAVVAILADPEGPVLAAESRDGYAVDERCCDPRRPRRAGAAFCRSQFTRRPTRSCDPRRPRRAGAGCRSCARTPSSSVVAILADPKGRCWSIGAGRVRRRPGGVAILADPEGPVLVPL